jgi:hypothetical protein
MKMAPEPDARTVDVAGTSKATISFTRRSQVSSPRRARDATICVHHAHSRQKKLVNGRRTFDSKESFDGTAALFHCAWRGAPTQVTPVRSLS